VRSSGDWLELTVDDHLEVDAWELDAHLAAAGAAERAGAPTTALASYGAALPLWRGEPLSDTPFALWAEPVRTRLRSGYVAAAIRAGELWLAARAGDDARRAASCAIAADATSEPAYRLLARSYLANGDRSSACSTLERGIGALADIGVEPDETTAVLLASLAG
jgi:DNA-binding SARP family transcriptional activator